MWRIKRWRPFSSSLIAFVPSSPEKRIHEESSFFYSRCFIMISCKSTGILEVANLTMTKNLSGFFSEASTKRTKIDICERSASSVDSSASIVKSPAAIKSVMIWSLKKSPTAFKNFSALKVKMYVEFFGALLICWKMSSTLRLARYSIVSSKLFFTSRLFLARKFSQ